MARGVGGLVRQAQQRRQQMVVLREQRAQTELLARRQRVFDFPSGRRVVLGVDQRLREVERRFHRQIFQTELVRLSGQLPQRADGRLRTAFLDGHLRQIQPRPQDDLAIGDTRC